MKRILQNVCYKLTSWSPQLKLTTNNDFPKMTVYLLSRTKQKTFQISQSEKIPGNVCYILELENQEFIFRLHWRPKQSIFEKNIFVFIIFSPLAFTVTEISVVLTFNLDLWEIEKQWRMLLSFSGQNLN